MTFNPSYNSSCYYRYASEVERKKISFIETIRNKFTLEGLDVHKNSEISVSIENSSSSENYLSLYMSPSRGGKKGFYLENNVIKGIVNYDILRFDFISIIKKSPQRKRTSKVEDIELKRKKENCQLIVELRSYDSITLIISPVIRQLSHSASREFLNPIAKVFDNSYGTYLKVDLEKPVIYYPDEVKLIVDNYFYLNNVTKENLNLLYKSFDFEFDERLFDGQDHLLKLLCQSFGKESEQFPCPRITYAIPEVALDRCFAICPLIPVMLHAVPSTNSVHGAICPQFPVVLSEVPSTNSLHEESRYGATSQTYCETQEGYDASLPYEPDMETEKKIDDLMAEIHGSGNGHGAIEESQGSDIVEQENTLNRKRKLSSLSYHTTDMTSCPIADLFHSPRAQKYQDVKVNSDYEPILSIAFAEEFQQDNKYRQLDKEFLSALETLRTPACP